MMLRQVARHSLRASQKARLTTAAPLQQKAILPDSTEITQEIRDNFHPKIGQREIVGPGFNNVANYVDLGEFPCPAIRFKETTPEIQALRDKEKGDWNSLTVEDKKALYRASFRHTFSEFTAHTGEWKSVLAGILLGLSLTGWLLIWIKLYVVPAAPESTTSQEWKEKQVERMLQQRAGAVGGLSSKYDYEKGQWK